MSMINLILEPQPDGTVRLPLPPELQHVKVRVEARVEAAEPENKRAICGLLKDVPGEFWISPDFDEPLEDFKDYMP